MAINKKSNKQIPPMANLDVPRFAVVGHPNKGKSSIVSTLASDNRVAISETPGTTTVSQTYPMIVDGQRLYELIDTPGFQRARAVLNWLKVKVEAFNFGADERYKAINLFIEDERCQQDFPDEYQLLMPLMKGSGILYVVDGSRPYGREYEAEMEILRWTGQPSMALINMIGKTDFSDQWHHALGQYFKIVRMFNPMRAEWDKRLSLLKAFGEIYQPWHKYLYQAVDELNEMRNVQKQQSALLIADELIELLGKRIKKRVNDEKVSSSFTEQLHQDYMQKLRKIESNCHKNILSVYHHQGLDAKIESFVGLDLDLFSEQGWSLFGLNNKELLMTGVAGGAAVGSVFDMAVGGASLLAGAGIGALVGGLSVWFSQDRMAKIKILGMPFGERFIKVGPISNPNFPFVVIARALTLHHAIEDRSHAQRGALSISNELTGASLIDEDLRKKFVPIFNELRSSGGDISEDKKQELIQLIYKVMKSIQQQSHVS